MARIKIALASIFIVLSVFFLAVRNNWTMHAWFNLMMHGKVFCRMVDSRDVTIFPVDFPGGLVAIKLVYSRSQYVGYIDNIANFFPASPKPFITNACIIV